MSFEADNLLEHTAFARRLAAALAGADRADDLVQDAWADVLAAPPRDTASPRGLFATILRRGSARARRGEARRGRREREVARPERMPSAAEIAERVELQRRIADALDALPVTQREAIVLRFYEGLGPAEIARLAEVPVETVRTRIKRGLARLRELLDREFGSRGAWTGLVFSLVPHGKSAATAPLVLSTVFLMSRTATGIVVVLIAAITAWCVWPAPSAQVTTHEPVHDPVTSVAPFGDDNPSPAAAGSARVDVTPATVAVPTEEAATLPEATLRVVDATTHEELVGVDVLRGVPAYRGRVHPGTWAAEHELVRDAASPIRLPTTGLQSPDQVETYWVSATGHAWAHIAFEHTTGGERVVALERAARLVVHVDTYDPEWNFAVRIYQPDAKRFASCLAEIRPTDAPAGPLQLEFDRLRIGSVRVDAHFGNWWDPPVVAASDTIELVGGTTVELNLGLDPRAMPAPAVPLAGTLQLPDGFEHVEVSPRLMSVGGPPMRQSDWLILRSQDLDVLPDREGLRAWDFGNVTPGEFLVVLEPLQVAHRVQVTTGSRREHIPVPPLGEVFVDLRDAESNEVLHDAKIAWGRQMPVGVSSWSLENASFDAERGLHHFVAPYGAIELTFRSDRFEDREQRVQVDAPRTAVRLTTKSLPFRWVRFVDRDAVVPATWSMRFALRPLGATGAGRLRAIEGGRAKLVVNVAGDYEIEFPQLDGFDDSVSRIVTFERRLTDEIVVELQRSR